MITQADRAAEKRRVKLEDVQRQLEDGSLTIRKMTAEERKRFPPSRSPSRAASAARAERQAPSSRSRYGARYLAAILVAGAQPGVSLISELKPWPPVMRAVR